MLVSSGWMEREEVFTLVTHVNIFDVMVVDVKKGL